MVFDINGDGAVSSADIKSGLALIGIYATHDEINLFMSRCDLDKDLKITAAEFERLITPVDQTYAQLLKSRKSNGVKAQYYRDDCF